MTWSPPDDWKLVRAARFLNLLDDAANVLSPVKLNAWAANTAVIGTQVATAFAWLGGHLHGLPDVGALWAPTMAWLSQAHITHHKDKQERNRTRVALNAENRQ